MSVACGSLSTAVLTERGGLWVFGENNVGQLGIGSLQRSDEPILRGGVGPAEGDEVEVLTGGLRALALSGGAAAAAQGAPAVAGHPFGDEALLMVAGGFTHYCAVTDSGAVWVWGDNSDGQLGLGAILGPFIAPVRWGPDLCGGEPIAMVACGNDHTLALTRTGSIWSCGDAFYGQTGVQPVDRVVVPTRVPVPATVFVMVAAGSIHSMAIDAQGMVWTWGYDRLGRLGQGTNTMDRQPRAVCLGLGAFAGAKVVYISASEHSAAVTAKAELWVWGLDMQGELLVPTLLGVGGEGGGARVSTVSCGSAHTLVLTEDGAVHSFGSGGSGELGHDDRVNRALPARIPQAHFGGARVVSAIAGSHVSFAISSEGILYSWGGVDFDEMDAVPALGLSADAPAAQVPMPVPACLPPGMRAGRSCGVSRRTTVLLFLGVHPRVGAASPLAALPDLVLDVIADQAWTPTGVYAGMGEGLLRMLAVRTRIT